MFLDDNIKVVVATFQGSFNRPALEPKLRD